jgi:hypothetical protein
MMFFGILSAIFAVPVISLLAVLYSFGLLIPLVVIPINALVYGLCLLPMVYLGRRGAFVAIPMFLMLLFGTTVWLPAIDAAFNENNDIGYDVQRVTLRNGKFELTYWRPFWD